jgi:hypothetical protein
VRYTREWEPLADILRRVIDNGATESEAKSDICHVMADGKVGVRVVVAPSDLAVGGKTFGEGNVAVPPRLEADDFDWLGSRPLKPWPIGPRLGEHYEWPGALIGRSYPIALVELRVEDVIRLLCGSRSKAASRDGKRPLNEKSAEQFTRDYIAQEKEKTPPTFDGLWAAAKEKNLIGRDLLKAAFKRIVGDVPRGRPRKSRAKSAEK